MQNDVRLINANALMKLARNHVNRMVDCNDIARFPTIDAIPVVRCKDCKNRGTPYNCPMRKLVMPWQGAGSYEDCTEDEGFCHMGAKKDGGAC